jgi:hypothetical protein
VALARCERDQRAGAGLDPVVAVHDRHRARYDLDRRPLSHRVLAELVSGAQVEHDGAAFRRGEQHARLALSGGLDRWEVPALDAAMVRVERGRRESAAAPPADVRCRAKETGS